MTTIHFVELFPSSYIGTSDSIVADAPGVIARIEIDVQPIASQSIIEKSPFEQYRCYRVPRSIEFLRPKYPNETFILDQRAIGVLQKALTELTKEESYLGDALIIPF